MCNEVGFLVRERENICSNTFIYLAFAEVFSKYCTTGSIFFSSLYPNVNQKDKFCQSLENVLISSKSSLFITSTVSLCTQKLNCLNSE